MKWIILVLVFLYLVGRFSKQQEKRNKCANRKELPTGSGGQSLACSAKSSGLIWEGSCPDIAFTAEGNRIHLSPTKVGSDANFGLYIQGTRVGMEGLHTFNIGNISTKIVMNSKRYEPWDWLDKVVGPGKW